MKVTSPQSRSNAALKAWATRRKPQYRARQSEARSKMALREWCRENKWQAVFFESSTGAPRTGIVDAIIVRIMPGKPDAIEVRLVQLKSGVAGLKAAEIARLKKAVQTLSRDWLLAAFDGTILHLVPDIPKRGAGVAKALARSKSLPEA
jgi:hypothetical protein